ncbi:uncharacterized protein N7525_005629 [Penicillium rubens]|uniref:uncharacterized protein n=1 Tax=Penicillium rubens TaxID=1108849 RepID=UPI002A5B0360|nr:uncharacterized protein N7525_005629 [Penicillium rubens]KAJ5840441.1 hypothetical protein N7525_005629 [Penicillium rubens]KAJ5868420.1 hypothetical protein N7534_002973 [Penicillium rubens]
MTLRSTLWTVPEGPLGSRYLETVSVFRWLCYESPCPDEKEMLGMNPQCNLSNMISWKAHLLAT